MQTILSFLHQQAWVNPISSNSEYLGVIFGVWLQAFAKNTIHLYRRLLLHALPGGLCSVCFRSPGMSSSRAAGATCATAAAAAQASCGDGGHMVANGAASGHIHCDLCVYTWLKISAPSSLVLEGTHTIPMHAPRNPWNLHQNLPSIKHKSASF